MSSIKNFIKDTFSWDAIAKILFWALAEVIDLLVKGEELSSKDKKAVQLTYAFGKIFGETWVNETDTELDNDALVNILGKCEDTAIEGNFQLPSVPDIS